MQLLLPVLKSASTSRSVVSEPEFGTKGWSMTQNLCFGERQQGRNKKSATATYSSVMLTMCLSLAAMQKMCKEVSDSPQQTIFCHQLGHSTVLMQFKALPSTATKCCQQCITKL
jgi:hypothetical protein